jgi:hypothetical protein
MSISDDVFENTSNGLSALISEILDDEAVAQPATLDAVRAVILSRFPAASVPLNRFSSDERDAVRDEIDALIEEYGADALAIRFMRPRVSDSLGCLMSAGVDELGTPTLGEVFAVAENGLLAHLVGQGEIDDDESQTVIAELKNLIERHGEDVLAEGFLGLPVI